MWLGVFEKDGGLHATVSLTPAPGIHLKLYNTTTTAWYGDKVVVVSAEPWCQGWAICLYGLTAGGHVALMSDRKEGTVFFEPLDLPNRRHWNIKVHPP